MFIIFFMCCICWWMDYYVHQDGTYTYVCARVLVTMMLQCYICRCRWRETITRQTWVFTREVSVGDVVRQISPHCVRSPGPALNTNQGNEYLYFRINWLISSEKYLCRTVIWLNWITRKQEINRLFLYIFPYLLYPSLLVINQDSCFVLAMMRTESQENLSKHWTWDQSVGLLVVHYQKILRVFPGKHQRRGLSTSIIVLRLESYSNTAVTQW